MKLAGLSIVMAIALVGCSSASSPTASPAATPAPTAPTTLTAAPTATPTPAATPVATPEPIPSAAPAGYLVIAYEDSAQVELIPPSGHRILIDVWNPDYLSRPATADDVLLTTHNHADHYLREYVDAFPGKKITISAGLLKTADATITSILGAHDSDPILSIDNYIFVVQIAGLRVVHFGDLGEERLTADQMRAIGSVDVAISQLSNSFSSMTAGNHKGVDQMNQVQPKILIVTHMIEDPIATVKMAAAAWKTAWTPRSWIKLQRTDLPAETTAIFVGEGAKGYGKIAGSPLASW